MASCRRTTIRPTAAAVLLCAAVGCHSHAAEESATTPATPTPSTSHAPAAAATPARGARAAPAAQPTYLFQLQVEASEDARRLASAAQTDEQLAQRLSAELRVPRLQPGPFGELSRRLPVATVEDGAVRLPSLACPAATDAPEPAHQSPSFVIDFDEAPVGAATREAQEALGEAPPPDDVVRFVHDFISDKTSRRNFDIASVVARRRSGDCSEHAVLLTALLRKLGHPARVVLGIVVLAIDGELQAAGHAWVERHDGQGWVLSDATRPAWRAAASERVTAAYLPVAVLTDEGPGFRAFSTRRGIHHVESIRLTAAAQ